MLWVDEARDPAAECRRLENFALRREAMSAVPIRTAWDLDRVRPDDELATG